MLNQFIEQSQEFDDYKTDFGPRPVNYYSFNAETADLMIPEDLFNGHTALRPTDWAFGQICQKLGPGAWPNTSRVLPKDYLQVCPPAMRAEQLNHWLNQLPENREWFVRAYNHSCRAVLSDRYATVGVTDTLNWTKQAFDTKQGGVPVEFPNPVVTPDVLHLRIIFRNIDTGRDPGGSHYGIGGYITTGEIGNRKLGAFPLIKRISCNNSIAIPRDQWSWESRHVGNSDALRSLFIGAIFHVLEGSVEALEKLLDAQTELLPDFTEYVDKLVERRGWTSDVRDAILVGSEGHESIFGVVQGVSAAANHLEDPDEQANMQLVAGEILFARRR